MSHTSSQKHRVRASAIVVEGDSILLVKHRGHGPEDGRVWWVPPGGGVEGEESLQECARRETFEETGLTVELGNIVYIREFLEPGWHHFEIFFLASSYSGRVVTGENPDVGFLDTAHAIENVRFVHRGEMQSMAVTPDELKTCFWDDLAEGFPTTPRYLPLKRLSHL